MNTNAAIYVRNVVKRYGENTILDGFSMTVERGTIYGLLGASGCGKTTILNCVVGRKSVHSGEIWVLGQQKGNEVLGSKVGYMPQELALVEEFTIRDAIFYFGTIFNMKNKEIEDRISELTNLLDLPPENKFLKNCSGGQKRRVSLAAALVHNPQLLILDEPTVGVDPILREKIWNYLRYQIDKNKISVIITTHYIEETKEANKIGLMRSGKLLTEDSPAKLLSVYQTDTLEEVFLFLSRKQEREGTNTGNIGTIINDPDKNSETVSTATSVESFAIEYGSEDQLTKPSVRNKARDKARPMSAFSLNKNRMKALLDKNWKQFYRNIGGIVFLVTFPLAQLWFFVNSVGINPKDLNLGIVNNESFTIRCNEFKWNETSVLHDYECHFKNLTCLYLTYLEHSMINKILYKSLPEAIQGVKHGEVVGILYIPSNFTKSFEERVRLGSGAGKRITDFGEIKAYMDMSNKEVGPILSKTLYRLFVDFQKDVLANCNISNKLSGIPIREHFIYGDDKQAMTYFLTPGMILLLVYLLGSTMTSNIIVKDKIDGVWDRSIVAGVSSLEITLAHLLLEAGFMFVQCLEGILMLFYIIKLECAGSLYAIFLLTYLEGICGMAYGLWISSLSNGVTQANLLCTGGYLPLLFVCGLFWPIEAMPSYLRLFSMFLPCTGAILSFRNVMAKGWSLWHPQVINGVGITVTWILIFAVASIWIIKIRN